MKKRCMWLGIVVLAGAFLVSCSEDEPETGPNKIQIYGVDYELVNGVLWHSTDNQVIETKEYVFTDHFTDEAGDPQTVETKGFTVGENSHSNGNFLLTLYDEGLALNTDLRVLRGKGACICFHLASPDKQQLSPGTYAWGDSKEDFTFRAYYSSVFHPEELKTASAEIKEGKVVVGKTGEIYTVDFDCKTDFGAEIRGTYQGHLDRFQIESEDVTLRADVKIEALLDSIKSVLDMYLPEEYGGHMTMNWLEPGPDFYQGNSFYSVTTGIGSVAAEASGKGNFDLALVYDRKNESVFWESPIRMGVWLNHQYECLDTWGEPATLSFPCHTRYMAAPGSFTEEDFAKVESSTDLNFEIEGEDQVKIRLDASFPQFLFFETGNGVRGIMKVKEATPFKVEVIDASEMSGGWPATLTSSVNPSLIVDMKFVSPLADMKIR